MRSILLFVTLLSLSACGVEIQDREENRKDGQQNTGQDIRSSATSGGLAKEATVAVIPMSGPGYRIHEGKKPSVYAVELQLPEGTRYLERFETAGLKTMKTWTFSATDSLKSVFHDHEVQSGITYEYRFFQTPERELLRTRLEIPRDEWINGRMNPILLLEGPPLRRLFLGPQAELVSEDRDLILQTEQLFSEPGAKWATFPMGQSAVSGRAGRSGGNLKLKANHAFGVLEISMRGEAGGDGIEALPQAPAASGLSFPRSFSSFAKDCVGVKAGGAGQDGGRGLKGGDGGAGGHTGSLEIEIQNSQDFKLAVEFEEGRGGAKGKGGAGQPGGAAGESEIKTIRMRQMGPDQVGEQVSICPILPAGPAGQTGPAGEDGRPGEPGRRGLYCFRENSICR